MSEKPPKATFEAAAAPGTSGDRLMALAHEQYEEAVLHAREAYKHDITELEQKVRSGTARKDEQDAIEAEIMRLETKLRDPLVRTSDPDAPASKKPTVAEARSALAAAAMKFPRENVRQAAREDAVDYGVRTKERYLGEAHPEWRGKDFNVMNKSPEGRARNADVLAKAAGVEAERDALRGAETELIKKEQEHYEKGILRRGLRNMFGGSRAERKAAERNMDEAALSYAARLESSVKERVEEKRRSIAEQLKDTAKYKPGSKEREDLEKMLRRCTDGTLETRYRQTIASRDVTERGDKAREAARKEALASRSLNVAEIAALSSLRYLAEVNKGLEKRAGKTGARVIRALVISGGAAGIAACFGPVAAGAMFGATSYRVVRSVVGGSLGTIGGGLTGTAYEKTFGKRAAANLRQQYGQEIRSVEDIQAARRAYGKGNAEAIERKTKYAELLGAAAVGGGFSLGSAYALADAHFTQGLEHGLAALKHDVADLHKHAIAQAHAAELTLGMEHAHAAGSAGASVHSVALAHDSMAGPEEARLPSNIDVPAVKGLGYEAMLHRLQEEAAKQGLVAGDFPPGSDMHELLSASPRDLPRAEQLLAIKHHMFNEATGVSSEVDRDAHMTFLVQGEGKGSIMFQQHDFIPEPPSPPLSMPGAELPPHRGFLPGEPQPGRADLAVPLSHQTPNMPPGNPVPASPDLAAQHAFAPFGVADHYHSGDAVELSGLANVSVEVPDGLGWEAGARGLFDRLHGMGVDTSFPPHSDIARLALAAAKGPRVFNAELHGLALEHHVASANGNMVIPKGTRFSIDGNGDVAMHTPSQTGVERPLPYPTPSEASRIPPPERAGVVARHAATPGAEEKATTEFLNQQSFDNERRGINMPVVEHGTVPHELTDDRLNEYVLQHPGARGPFIIGPHGEVLEESPSAHEALAGARQPQPKVPAFTRVGEPVPPPRGGAESLVDQSGERIDITHAKVYLTPDHEYAVYGGTPQQRVKAALDFLYKNPGKTVWKQGDYLVNGQPYVEPVSSVRVEGDPKTTIFFPNQVQSDRIGKVIVPENLLRPAP